MTQEVWAVGTPHQVDRGKASEFDSVLKNQHCFEAAVGKCSCRSPVWMRLLRLKRSTLNYHLAEVQVLRGVTDPSHRAITWGTVRGLVAAGCAENTKGAANNAFRALSDPP